MSEALVRLSARLKEIRKEKGMTQQEIANELGVSRLAYRYYENAERTPDIDFLDALYKFTGCTLEFLMGYDKNEVSLSVDDLPAAIELRTGLDSTAQNLIQLKPQYGLLLNYLVTHPRFGVFSSRAFYVLLADYETKRIDFGIDWKKMYPPFGDSTIEETPGVYRTIAMADVLDMLTFDVSLCNPIDEPASTYESRYIDYLTGVTHVAAWKKRRKESDADQEK